MNQFFLTEQLVAFTQSPQLPITKKKKISLFLIQPILTSVPGQVTLETLQRTVSTAEPMQ